MKSLDKTSLVLCSVFVLTALYVPTIYDNAANALLGDIVVQIPLTANDDSAVTDEDVPVTIDVMANDNLSGTRLFVVSSVTPPSNGVAVINDDDTITYSPNADFFSSDSFQYTVTDSLGLVQDSAIVTVTINPVNDSPVAVDDNIITDEDTPVSFFAEENDFDADGDEIFVVSVTPGSNGSTEIAVDGAVVYTPNPDFSGQDYFTYVLSDINGATDTGDVFVTINNPPTANDDSAQTEVNIPVTIDILANDEDPNGDIILLDSFDATSQFFGTITLDDNATPQDQSDDKLIYTPPPDAFGTDTFSYTISDGNGGSDSAIVVVTVTDPNS